MDVPLTLGAGSFDVLVFITMDYSHKRVPAIKAAVPSERLHSDDGRSLPVIANVPMTMYPWPIRALGQLLVKRSTFFAHLQWVCSVF